MYCLDTDISVGFLRGTPAAVKKITDLQHSVSELAVTALTLSELYKGAFLSSDTEKNLRLVEKFMKNVTFLLQDNSSCIMFGRDFAFLKNKGLMTQQMDLMIASICKANDMILLTHNLKDFKNIPGLSLEEW